MRPLRRRRSTRPPRRLCEDCGGEFYGWAGVRCPECFRKALAYPQGESLREFRRRLRGTQLP